MQGSEEFNENVNEFFERSFEEVEGGFYDGKGFYVTPEGSFWDETGVYFNREGRDRHGGYYDEYCIYVPGPDWNEEYGCYNDEMFPISRDEEVKQTVFEKFKDQLIEDFQCYEKYFRNPDVEDLDEIDREMAQIDECEIFNQYLGAELEQMNQNHQNHQNDQNNQQNFYQPNNNENCNGINVNLNEENPKNSNNNLSTVQISFENKSNLNFSNGGQGFNRSPFNTNHK